MYRDNVKLNRFFDYGDPKEFTDKGFKKITEYHFEYEFNLDGILKSKIHLILDTLGHFKANEKHKLSILKELLIYKTKYDSLFETGVSYFKDNRFEIEVKNSFKDKVRIEILDKDEIVEPYKRSRNGIVVSPSTFMILEEFKLVEVINI
jgi:hypothetical protein